MNRRYTIGATLVLLIAGLSAWAAYKHGLLGTSGSHLGTSASSTTPTTTQVGMETSPDQFDILFPKDASVVDVSKNGHSMEGQQYKTYKDTEGRFEFRYDPKWGGVTVKKLDPSVRNTGDEEVVVCSRNTSYILKVGTAINKELQTSIASSIGDYKYWRSKYVRGILAPQSEFGVIIWTKDHFYSLGEHGGSCDTSEEPAPENPDVQKAIAESKELEFSFVNSLKITR